MSRTRLLLMSVVTALALIALAAPVLAATKTVTITEASERYHFTPSTITVAAGDTVRWKNTTDAQHTVTSDSGSELGSAKIGTGNTYSHTFAAAGTFAYHCTIHDYMKGKVVVLAAGASVPSTDTVPASAARTGSLLPLGLLVVAGITFVLFVHRTPRRR